MVTGPSIYVVTWIDNYKPQHPRCIYDHKCNGWWRHLMCHCRLPLVKLCHLCGGVGLKWWNWLGEGWGQRLVGNGAVNLNIRPEWSEVHTLQWWPPPQVRDFRHLKTSHIILLAVCTLYNALHIFFVKNKPYERIISSVFILGPVSIGASN